MVEIEFEAVIFAVVFVVMLLFLAAVRTFHNPIVKGIFNVLVTFCLYFLVLTVAYLVVEMLGRDPSQAEGGGWFFVLAYAIATAGWFVYDYARSMPLRSRKLSLSAGLGTALVIVSVTFAATSPESYDPLLHVHVI
ncbi:MAG TPA: hypothetical protein VK646_03280 [Actinomycetota bacterium]|nr:hypothetical protein [Actinomycetota bacterium]